MQKLLVNAIFVYFVYLVCYSLLVSDLSIFKLRLWLFIRLQLYIIEFADYYTNEFDTNAFTCCIRSATARIKPWFVHAKCLCVYYVYHAFHELYHAYNTLDDTKAKHKTIEDNNVFVLAILYSIIDSVYIICSILMVLV